MGVGIEGSCVCFAPLRVTTKGTKGPTKHDLVEVGAAEEVAAGAADQFAAAVIEPGGAGGAEDGVVLGRERALAVGGLLGRIGGFRLHEE